MDTRNIPSEMMNKLYDQKVNNKSYNSHKITNISCNKSFKENEQKLEAMQDNDRGDVKINSEMPSVPQNYISHQYPEHFAAGECSKSYVNNYSDYHNNPEPRTSDSKTMPETNVPMQFTSKMIEDQEMLVSSMSLQGIPEVLIRRHFDRLLEEQSKQLLSLTNNNNSIADKKKSKKEDESNLKKHKILEQINCNVQNNVYNPNSNPKQAIDNHNCSCNFEMTTKLTQNDQKQLNVKENENENRTHAIISENNHLHKVEPSSLLKIRLQKEVINSKNRNNGLQEDEVALGIMQNTKYKCDSSQCASLIDEDSLAYLKLNGTQDKFQMQKFQAMYAPETIKIYEKQRSSNGLENIRSPNNPQWAPKSNRCRNEQYMKETPAVLYPPQKSYYNCCPPIVYSSSDNSKHEHSGNCQCNKNDGLSTRVENQESSNNDYVEKPLQFNNQNNFTYCPELQEPKIIGGLTYFARKPQSLPKSDLLHNALNHANKLKSEN